MEKSTAEKLQAGEYQNIERLRPDSSDEALADRMQDIKTMLERDTAKVEVVQADAEGKPLRYLIRSTIDGSILGYEDTPQMQEHITETKRAQEKSDAYFHEKLGKKDVVQHQFGKENPNAKSH